MTTFSQEILCQGTIGQSSDLKHPDCIMRPLDWDDIWFQPHLTTTVQNRIVLVKTSLAKLVATDFWLRRANKWWTTIVRGNCEHLWPIDWFEVCWLYNAPLLIDMISDFIARLIHSEINFVQNLWSTYCHQRPILEFSFKLVLHLCDKLSDLKHVDCRLRNDCWLRRRLISCSRCTRDHSN